MTSQTVVVVGDRFGHQFRHTSTMSISDLLRQLPDDDPNGLVVSIGQGLSAAQLGVLHRSVDGGRCRFASSGRPFPRHAERALTHKRDARNVMISEPAPDGADGFVVDLLIDERCEVLADHLTGQHIPAVALTEAARQTWTAVTERYFLDGPDPTRFVIESVESVFHHFVFPFAATLRYRLLSLESTAVGQVYRCHITIDQSGRTVADIAASYRTIPTRIGEKHEQLAARHLVASEIERLALEPERQS